MKRSHSAGIALLVVFLDQLTKYLVRNLMSPFDTIKVLPFFDLVSVRNEGAAFGMLKGLGNAAFIAVSLIAIVFVLFLLFKGREDKFALSLILGGAAGNLIDRVAFGRVTDFIDLFAGTFHWPAFNIADSALTIGLMLLVLGSLFRRQAGEKA
ncbi:MAG: signal peptidase II [Nitrospirae bacterium]|nr:signal peptidase II [Nitrospirota bacterium]